MHGCIMKGEEEEVEAEEERQMMNLLKTSHYHESQKRR